MTRASAAACCFPVPYRHVQEPLSGRIASSPATTTVSASVSHSTSARCPGEARQRGDCRRFVPGAALRNRARHVFHDGSEKVALQGNIARCACHGEKRRSVPEDVDGVTIGLVQDPVQYAGPACNRATGFGVHVRPGPIEDQIAHMHYAGLFEVHRAVRSRVRRAIPTGDDAFRANVQRPLAIEEGRGHHRLCCTASGRFTTPVWILTPRRSSRSS
jgi:hypothetical protein